MVALAVVAMMSTMASQQYLNSMPKARVNTCHLTKAEIEVQVERYYRNMGRWPQTNLSDIAGLTEYFSDRPQRCPVDNSAYRLDPRTRHVVGHNH